MPRVCHFFVLILLGTLLVSLSSCTVINTSCSGNDLTCRPEFSVLLRLRAGSGTSRPPSGTRDTTFGNGQGYIELGDIGGAANAGSFGEGLAIDSAGFIYVNGYTTDVSGISLFVCRLFPDGSLDTSYASSAPTPGCVNATTAGGNSGNGAISFDSSSRVLISGTAGSNMIVWRFTTSGAYDTTFNGGGYNTHAIGPGTVNGDGEMAIADPGGGVLVAGRTNCGATCDWTIWRYTSGGALDVSWNGSGYVQTAGGYATTMDLAIDGAGRRIAAGFANNQMQVSRYNSNGSLDASFGGTGTYAFPNGSFLSSSGLAMAVDASNNIFVAGSVLLTNSPYDTDMAVWKVTAGGSLDTSFAGTGYVTHANAAGGIASPVPSDEGLAAAVDSSGRIVVLGASCNNSGFGNCDVNRVSFSTVVWRYNSDGTPDTTFNNGSHFLIVDTNVFHQNGYATRFGLKIDSEGRIVIGAARVKGAVGSQHQMRVYRFWA